MKSLFIGGPADGKHIDVADGQVQVKIPPPLPALERITHANATPKNTTFEDVPYYAGRLRNHRGESFRVFHTRDIEDVVNALIDGYRQPLHDVDHLAAELENAKHELSVLAKAIRSAAVKAGICRADAALTGPHLLMLCDDLAEAAREVPAGEPVAWRYIRRANGEVILDSIELRPWKPELLEDIRQHYDVEEIPLYAAPPVPAWKSYKQGTLDFVYGWNSCRGAMLAGKEKQHD
ncbi:hypothetical protein [Chromobacterium haemolyticum]|uniref:hypothetical protein n=1 Tax=Chromobacterium haemolyticum TaxID=394935 RepID=UPI0013168D1A|nr:hypothetical protein [Chromobacterium haemolyticum]BBH13428.1 hypothetical protein CH06BL_26760 [Chromobacterium haemolyticum]